MKLLQDVGSLDRCRHCGKRLPLNTYSIAVHIASHKVEYEGGRHDGTDERTGW